MAKESPLYFWQPSDLEPEWGSFSQWEVTPFVVDGQTYVTAEMWMMVGKARLFGDADSEGAMRRTTDPKEHQGIGRKVAGYDGAVWDQSKPYPSPCLSPLICRSILSSVSLYLYHAVFKDAKWNLTGSDKSRIVEEGNWHKFNSDPALRKKLLDTGDRLLVEVSSFCSLSSLRSVTDDFSLTRRRPTIAYGASASRPTMQRQTRTIGARTCWARQSWLSASG